MAMPIFPKTIKLNLWFYMSVSYPNGNLVMFEYEIKASNADWLFAFSREVEIPVPYDLTTTMLQRVNPSFDAAIHALQAEVGTKINQLEQLRGKFLALEA